MNALHTKEDALRLTWRDVRVTANGRWLTQRVAPPKDASQFTQAILNRYAGRPVRWPGLGLVFRQERPVSVVQSVHHRPQLHLAPRLALTVLAQPVSAPVPVRGGPELRSTRQPGEREAAPVSTPPSAWPRPTLELKQRFETFLMAPIAGQRGSILRLAQQRTNRIVRQTETELRHKSRRIEVNLTKQLLHRLVTRGERIEPAAARGRAGPDTVPSIDPVGLAHTPPMQPVPRITQRPPADVPETTGAMSDSHQPAFQTGLERPDLAPVDISRLTDQVVRAIDQRIIAHRERMGRV